MQPRAPNSNYDFIMKDGQPAKKGFKLPSTGLPKKAVWAIGGVLGLMILAVIYSAVSGGGGSGQPYANALARGQEIIRVSTSVGQLAQDVPTQNLAATTQNALTSEQTQLTAYLTTQKIKVSTLALNGDKNTSTDSAMQTANTNGNLNSVYAAYLKSQLQLYAADLKTAYNSSGSHGKTILSNAFNSTEVLLQSPEIAGAN